MTNLPNRNKFMETYFSFMMVKLNSLPMRSRLASRLWGFVALWTIQGDRVAIPPIPESTPSHREYNLPAKTDRPGEQQNKTTKKYTRLQHDQYPQWNVQKTPTTKKTSASESSFATISCVSIIMRSAFKTSEQEVQKLENPRDH